MPSSCSIVFNEHPNGIYSSGEILSGKVALVTQKLKAIKGVYIAIYGYAEVEWSEEQSTTGAEGQNDTETIIYKARDEYFTSRIDALSSSDGSRFDLLPGKYSFDFQIQLPQELPTSYRGRHGEIRYEVAVTIDRPWRFNNIFKQPFNIISSVNLNLNPIYRQPSDRTNEKFFSRLYCCGQTGQIILKGTIPYSGFASGQIVPIKVFIKNLSNIECHEATVKLLKISEYRSDKPRPKSKYETVALVGQKFVGLEKTPVNEINCKLKIPPTPPSSLNTCKIIEISYFVEIQLKTQGFHTNMFVRLPITIGTVPMFFGASNSIGIITNQPLSFQSGIDENMLAGLLKAAPPSYEEAIQDGPAYTRQIPEDEFIQAAEFIPKYPVYHYSPEAVMAPPNALGGTENCIEINSDSIPDTKYLNAIHVM